MKDLFRKIKTVRSWRAGQRRLFIEACLSFWKARFFLFTYGSRFVERFVSDGRDGRLEPDCPVPELIRAFRTAQRNQPLRPTCLVSAIAERIFLERHGVSARVRIGVRKEGKGIHAHAWCVVMGRSDGGEMQFAPLEMAGSPRKGESL
ncbi:MAG: lasso peptide biosynthesis B2 protein [Candidatus Omnitrophica bacterium]|nr:lasso peptide biosynthesis B2 protein [Candidatus Omnitrophota bacterium]